MLTQYRTAKLNAPSPILVTPRGRVTPIRAVPANAKASIVVTPLGMIIEAME